MYHYTLILSDEQRALLVKALDYFSTNGVERFGTEHEDATALRDQLKVCRENSFGTVINNLTK